MADRNETVTGILRERVSAIIRANDQALAADAMNAAVNGGFRVVEFTMTTPGALELVSVFARRPGLLVGAGTVMTPQAVEDAAAAGAKFIVSPIFDPAVIAAAAKVGLATLPGAFTPTEMQAAHLGGADFIKIFPAPPGGTDFVYAVRGPLPHLRLFPTAGFTAENFPEWLDAGCAGCGFVRPLFDAQDMARRDFAAIEARAMAIHQRLSAWRPGSVSTGLRPSR